MSHKIAGEMAKVRGQVDQLQIKYIAMEKDLDYMKEIVHQALLTKNPDYRRKFVLNDMSDFLNKRLVND